MIGRALATAMVATTVFLALRNFVAEKYLVPSSSMEPTLHGDPDDGDVVLVDKTGWLRGRTRAELSRFDLVVVRDSERPGEDHLVKRVVSTGDEVVALRGGDLFVKPLGGGAFRRVEKHPVEHRDLLLTYYAVGSQDPPPPPSAPGEAPTHLNIDAPWPEAGWPMAAPVAAAAALAARVTAAGPWRPPPGCIGTRAPVDVSFLAVDGRRVGRLRGFSPDVGMELWLRPGAGCDGCCMVFEHRGRRVVLTYRRDGGCRLEGAAPAASGQGPPLRSEAANHLAFGHLDGRIFLVAGQRLVLLVPLDLEVDVRGDGREDVPENGLWVGVAGAGAPCARLLAVRLFHDVYYRAEPIPFQSDPEQTVEPGELYLLGDNTFDSIDSRRRGPFPAADVIGRPLAVIGPRPRLRWLPR